MSDETGSGDLNIKEMINFKPMTLDEIRNHYKKPSIGWVALGVASLCTASMMSGMSGSTAAAMTATGLVSLLMYFDLMRMRTDRILNDIFFECRNEIRWEEMKRLKLDQEPFVEDWINRTEQIRKMP